MNIGVILEVAIGVLFVWVLLALITSQISEWISTWLQWKSRLSCDGMCEDFYAHPLIKGLHTSRGKRKPSAIPTRQFVAVVFDVFLHAGTEKSISQKPKPVFLQLKDAIHEAEGTERGTASGEDGQKKYYNKTQLARALHTLLIDVSDDLDKADESLAEARKRMEAWFDDAMERLSGAFKRQVQVTTLLIGIFIAAAMNADSLAIANGLWTQPLVREAVVTQAGQFQLPENQTETTPWQEALKSAGDLQALSVPVGWAPENVPTTGNGWFLKVGGILVSGIAAAQGAPFWFDIMRKILNFRSGSETKKEEKT